MTRWGYLSLVLVLAAFLGAAYAHVNTDRIPGDRIAIHCESCRRTHHLRAAVMDKAAR